MNTTIHIAPAVSSPVDFAYMDETTDPNTVIALKNDTTYRPFRVSNVQSYNPLYSKVFSLTHTNYNNVTLNSQFRMLSENLVYDTKTSQEISRDVFVKFSPLLDPIRFMVGRYDTSDPTLRAMPALNDSDTECNPKIIAHMNSAYTDNFFCYLSSKLNEDFGFMHSVLYYGSFLCVQERFRINVEDELDYLTQSVFFKSSVGDSIYIDHYESELEELRNAESRRNKRRLHFGDEVDIDPENSVPEQLEEEIIDTEPVDLHTVSDPADIDFEDAGVIHDTESVSDGSVENNDSEESIALSTEYSTESEYSDDDENMHADTHAYINNFPVQMICMEKCAGTLDSLMEKRSISDEECISALFQIIMTLVVYQHVFDFTHNDLHTNNVMYSLTDITHIVYKYDGKTYRVPTFGKIYKIIDFGRSIYTVRGTVFCSDSFAENGDANGQYNCEPFFNPNKKRISPNPSFDLCRLGCSMIDFFSDGSEEPRKMQLVNLITNWCSDEKGQNILYKKNGEERYPGFKMYKMVARLKHDCVPKDQLSDAIFSHFCDEYTIVETDLEYHMDVDAFPAVCSEPSESIDPYD